MKIGYIQNDPVFGDKDQNFKQVKRLLSSKNADLIVLPELFATGYAFQSNEEANGLAENLDGETIDFLKEMSQITKGTIIAGFAEKDGEHLYNSSAMVKDNEILGVYRKIHLYYKEKLWFQPGNRPFQVFEDNGVKIGMMICFDWIYPESARSLALLGADIIAHSANLVLPFCQKATVTRCLENRVFTVTANRIGNEIRGEDNFKFTGASQITAYNGDVLSSAPIDKTSVDIVDIDIELARNKSLNQYNNLFKDRNRDLYYL